jgi:hypothetical protein
MGNVSVRSTNVGGFVANTTSLTATGVSVDYNYLASDTPTYTTETGGTTVDGSAIFTEVGTYTGTGRTVSIATANSNCSTPASSFECSYVNQLKSHAALLGWIWEDEPNLGGSLTYKVPNPFMRDNYTATKTADTDHPHFIGFYGYDFLPGATNTYAKDYSWLTNAGGFSGVKTFLGDVVGGDIYPYGFTPMDGSIKTYSGGTLNLETTLGAEDNYITYNYGLLPTVGIPCPEEVGHWGCSTLNTARGENQWPFGHQLKNELWLRTIHGAKGIEYFAFFCGQKSYQIAETTAFKTLMETGDGVTPLYTIILQPKSTKYTPANGTVSVSGDGVVSVPLNHATVSAGSDGRVDYMIREYNGETWVFAARVKTRGYGETFANCTECLSGNAEKGWPDSNNTNIKSATIPVTGLVLGTVVTVLGESRTFSSGGGYIEDTFTDYGVHIYRMGTATGPDTTAPTVNAFDIATTSASLTVPINSFTCSDNVGVTGYCATTTNSSSGCSWTSSAPSSITFATEGTKTAYGWCKDAAANVSTVATDTSIVDVLAQYTLTVSKAGTGTGTVTSALGGINCGTTCLAIYSENTTVTLTAVATGDDTFYGWSGSGCSGTGTCVVVMTQNSIVIPTFTAAIPTYLATITPAGTGTGMTDPSDSTFGRKAGETVSITQTPSVGSYFVSWGGTCGCAGAASTCSFAMPARACTIIPTWANGRRVKLGGSGRMKMGGSGRIGTP